MWLILRAFNGGADGSQIRAHIKCKAAFAWFCRLGGFWFLAIGGINTSPFYRMEAKEIHLIWLTLSPSCISLLQCQDQPA
jgi:hypothetical protein